MHPQPKPWATPKLERLELTRARELIIAALEKIENIDGLQDECAKLKSILGMMDADHHQSA